MAGGGQSPPDTPVQQEDSSPAMGFESLHDLCLVPAASGSRPFGTSVAATITMTTPRFTRKELIAALNGDLAREYQAIIAYVVYSQILKGAEYMAIAGELETHAAEELQHAITIAKHIDYLGGTPVTTPLSVKMSDDPATLLRADLENENNTIRNYRERVQQCEALAEYGIAEDVREILRQEQEHQTDLATALGENVPDVSARSSSVKHD
jgi:bacterioferritin